jgi:photosystem II stability/assembly factor-like uncharacterized protein
MPILQILLIFVVTSISLTSCAEQPAVDTASKAAETAPNKKTEIEKPPEPKNDQIPDPEKHLDSKNSTPEDESVPVPLAPIISSFTPIVAEVGLELIAVTPVNEGGQIASCSIAPILSEGLSISNECLISGTPTVITASEIYTITASNAGGESSATVSITVNDKIPAISYVNPSVAMLGMALPAITPLNSGGSITACSINPILTEGLTISDACLISGIPTIVAGSITYTVTATNSGGSADTTIAFAVNDISPQISFGAGIVATKNTPIISVAAANGGGAIISCSINPTLPLGLNISSSCVISGTPTVISSSMNYTVTTVNSGGSSNAMITVTVNDVAPNFLYSGDILGNIGSDIGLISPLNTGGIITSCSVSPPLISGLNLSSFCAITGTPTIVAGPIAYAITAINSGGSASTSIQITTLPVPPASPVLTAFTNIADSTVTVNWSNVDNESGYRVERALYSGTCGSFAEIATTLVDNTSYGDVGRTPTVTYCYRVRGKNSGGNSDYSPPAQVTMRISAPSATISTVGIKTLGINWATISGAQSYNLYWGTSPGISTSSNVVTGVTPNYNHINLSGGIPYYYKVAAVKNSLVGMLSGEITGTPLVGTTGSPAFYPPGSLYNSNQLVTITSATAETTIRYTTDGSNPTETTGSIYSAPVSVGSTLILKAIAFKTNYQSSTSNSTYTRLTQASTPWNQQLKPLESNNFNGIYLIDAQTGWAVGENGSVLKTVNGGGTWLPQSIGVRANFFDVFFKDANHGWIVGANNGAIGAVYSIILRTIDGGATWEIQYSGISNPLYDVYFLDNNIGWAVSWGDSIIKTVDGGITWTVQHTAASGRELEYLTAISFVDASKGWAVGSHGYVLTTSDGGTSWSTQNSGITNRLEDIHFEDSSNGWASGCGTIVHTINGGLNWTAQNPGTTECLNGLSFAGSNTGWAVGDAGIVVNTINGGSTWASQTSGTASKLSSVSFANSIVGSAIGNSGAIVRTVDAGATWVTQALQPNSSNLNDLFFVDPSTGWVVGESGKILKTSDSGVSWVAQSSGTANRLLSAYFVDSNTGWVVGSSGKILKTTDGGSNWTAQVCNCFDAGKGRALHLEGIYFLNGSTGWAVGEQGLVLKSSDGGINWVNLSIAGEVYYLHDVDFIDSNNGWVVGDGRVIYRTTDGGSTWTKKVLGGAGGLFGVQFLNSTTGWAVGGGGVISKTTNGGSTWTTQYYDTLADLNALKMLNSSVGFAVGSSGTIIKTTDGGSTWTTQVSGMSELTGVKFIDANTGWAVGQMGIIKTTTGGE